MRSHPFKIGIAKNKDEFFLNNFGDFGPFLDLCKLTKNSKKVNKFLTLFLKCSDN